MEGDVDDPKLSKQELDTVLHKRYSEVIGKFSQAFSGEIPPEEAINRQEIELAIVLTTFPRTPTLTPSAATRLNNRMIAVKSEFYKKAKTNKFKVDLDYLSTRGILDTLDGEIEKTELNKENPEGKRHKGDAQVINYLKAAREVAKLAVTLER